MQERREFPRIRGYFPLNYRLRSTQKNRTTLTRDLSLGGLKIITFESLPVKEELFLEISLGVNVINAKGKVSWIQQSSHGDRFYCGVKFDDLPNDTQKAIERYTSTV
jgi:c-di-GMP-binding flagellar brake protein YcgR